MVYEILNLFRSGDTISFLILALVCVAWVIIIERFLLLQFVYRVRFSSFNGNIKKMLSGSDFERAKKFCMKVGGTGLPLIVTKAIDAYQNDAFRVRQVVSEETLRFMPRIRRRLTQLPHLATAAVLLGALGAVYGVWQAFQVADVLELGIKSFAFSAELGRALIPLTLAIGGAVTIMLPYGFLDGISARLEGDIELSLTIVLNILAPEQAAVITAQPAVMMAPQVDEQVVSPTEPIAAEPSVASSGGDDNDIIERIDTVPDEEEII